MMLEKGKLARWFDDVKASGVDHHLMKKISRVIMLLSLWVLLPSSSLANTLEGWVVAIADGDTLTVLSTDQQQTKVRLDNIDSPEKKQPFGTAAKKTLSDMVFNKRVVINHQK